MATISDLFELYREALLGEPNYYWENDIVNFLLERHKLMEKTSNLHLKENIIQEIEFAQDIWEAIKKIERGENYV